MLEKKMAAMGLLEVRMLMLEYAQDAASNSILENKDDFWIPVAMSVVIPVSSRQTNVQSAQVNEFKLMC